MEQLKGERSDSSGNQGTWPAMHQGPPLNKGPLRTSILNILQDHLLRAAYPGTKVVILGLPMKSELFVAVKCLSVMILGKRLCCIHCLSWVPSAEPS